MIKAIAIDDESFALEVIKSHASRVPFLELQASFTNAISGLEYLKNHPVDLVFLDINMPDISGIDLATLLPKETLVVFTTAYSDYAVKGFELDALDYLLKPFNLSRFLKACQKAQEWIDLRPKNEPAYLFVKTADGQVRVDFSDLLFCEAQGNYVTFQLANEKIISRMTLSETEKLLPAYFIRTHRSFLANKNQIQKVERHQVLMKGYHVPVSSSYMDQIKDLLQA
ncbi:LytTR family two component transcriptional regulator [Algoriphagus aquaeductus]|jgi:DNA-binding LytR/AlgR family response regulator|uniref:LytTR family two component transcriptional regulator n=1 Tax=Algoriphagus aquaeductus TaxID=475299 RepID=A0A326S121_9BACT|nr:MULTISPECIES: LytTR family DNA-binding domain-containing protein [Algoriphagus]PZV83276.1 LytTR family two component transcriptional regulator [Algoriphagus aquaeductus]